MGKCIEKVTLRPETGKWQFIAPCCKNERGFADKKAAEVALRLHKVGCKDC